MAAVVQAIPEHVSSPLVCFASARLEHTTVLEMISHVSDWRQFYGSNVFQRVLSAASHSLEEVETANVLLCKDQAVSPICMSKFTTSRTGFQTNHSTYLLLCMGQMCQSTVTTRVLRADCVLQYQKGQGLPRIL